MARIRQGPGKDPANPGKEFSGSGHSRLGLSKARQFPARIFQGHTNHPNTIRQAAAGGQRTTHTQSGKRPPGTGPPKHNQAIGGRRATNHPNTIRQAAAGGQRNTLTQSGRRPAGNELTTQTQSGRGGAGTPAPPKNENDRMHRHNFMLLLSWVVVRHPSVPYE